jgi:Tfp pilus assembly protein PilF
MLAQAYNGLEEFEKANEYYEKVKDVLKDEADFVKDYGLFLREEGKVEEANTWLAHYLTLVPGDIEVASLIDNEGW